MSKEPDNTQQAGEDSTGKCFQKSLFNSSTSSFGVTTQQGTIIAAAAIVIQSKEANCIAGTLPPRSSGNGSSIWTDAGDDDWPLYHFQYTIFPLNGGS